MASQALFKWEVSFFVCEWVFSLPLLYWQLTKSNYFEVGSIQYLGRALSLVVLVVLLLLEQYIRKILTFGKMYNLYVKDNV